MTSVTTTLEEAPEFQEVLDKLKIRGNTNIRKCHHCKVNRRPASVNVTENDEVLKLECGCSEEKAVCERLLVDQGILGGDVGNNVELRSLTQAEWYKLDHIMGALFGFKTSWLWDNNAMKKGLLAKAQNL